MKQVAAVILVAAILLFAPAAEAHPVPFSYLDVRLQATGLEAALVVHIFDVAHDLNITPVESLLRTDVVASRTEEMKKLLQSRLELRANGKIVQPDWSAPEILADRQSLRFRLTLPPGAKPGSVAVTTSLFPYDPQHQTFVNVYEGDEIADQMILNAAAPNTEFFAGTTQGTLAVIQKFIPSGIHHILIGPDHLLFLFGLLLLGGSIKRLALVVTAFTVAHSITLTLAALDLFTPPAHWIEPAIALSIVYVGADNILADGGRDFRPWIALGFGLIHGFGFAYVLRDMGLPTRALGWSLFSFNIGVELGQLLVVVPVAGALALLRRKSEHVGRQVAFAGSVLVIAAGTYWFVQRVFFPGGL